MKYSYRLSTQQEKFYRHPFAIYTLLYFLKIVTKKGSTYTLLHLPEFSGIKYTIYFKGLQIPLHFLLVAPYKNTTRFNQAFLAEELILLPAYCFKNAPILNTPHHSAIAFMETFKDKQKFNSSPNNHYWIKLSCLNLSHNMDDFYSSQTYS